MIGRTIDQDDMRRPELAAQPCRKFKPSGSAAHDNDFVKCSRHARTPLRFARKNPAALFQR